MKGKQEGDPEGADERNVELSAAERELLLTACQRYRNTIPAYLKAREGERTLLGVLIDKLSQ